MARKKTAVIDLVNLQGRCGSCRAWERYETEPGDHEVGSVGSCRLMPGTPVVLDEEVMTVYPEMAEDEWCLQHVPKQ